MAFLSSITCWGCISYRRFFRVLWKVLLPTEVVPTMEAEELFISDNAVCDPWKWLKFLECVACPLIFYKARGGFPILYLPPPPPIYSVNFYNSEPLPPIMPPEAWFRWRVLKFLCRIFLRFDCPSKWSPKKAVVAADLFCSSKIEIESLYSWWWCFELI